MKRKAIFLLVSIFLVMVFPLAAAADISCMDDQALLLTAEERADLEKNALDIQNTYGADILILTVNTLNGSSAETYADHYYVSGGFQENGILLLLAMAEREWYIYTSGSVIYAFSDRDIQNLGGNLADNLGTGNYYLAFNRYLGSLPSYLRSFSDSGVIPSSVSSPQPNLLLSLGVGLMVSLIVILIMVSSMNTKRKQASASGYMHSGSFHLRQRQDLFLYSKVDKVRKQENSGSGGKTTVHRSSGGRSHGGGGGKF